MFNSIKKFFDRFFSKIYKFINHCNHYFQNLIEQLYKFYISSNIFGFIFLTCFIYIPIFLSFTIDFISNFRLQNNLNNNLKNLLNMEQKEIVEINKKYSVSNSNKIGFFTLKSAKSVNEEQTKLELLKKAENCFISVLANRYIGLNLNDKILAYIGYNECYIRAFNIIKGKIGNRDINQFELTKIFRSEYSKLAIFFANDPLNYRSIAESTIIDSSLKFTTLSYLFKTSILIQKIYGYDIVQTMSNVQNVLSYLKDYEDCNKLTDLVGEEIYSKYYEILF